MSGPLAVLCAVIFVVAMPVMLPLAMLQHLYVERRKSKCVALARCANCQKMLGRASIERADIFWQEYMDERFRANERALLRFRVIRKVMAVCDCGQKYSYNEKSNCFEVLADLPS